MQRVSILLKLRSSSESTYIFLFLLHIVGSEQHGCNIRSSYTRLPICLSPCTLRYTCVCALCVIYTLSKIAWWISSRPLPRSLTPLHYRRVINVRLQTVDEYTHICKLTILDFTSDAFSDYDLKHISQSLAGYSSRFTSDPSFRPLTGYCMWPVIVQSSHQDLKPIPLLCSQSIYLQCCSEIAYLHPPHGRTFSMTLKTPPSISISVPLQPVQPLML